jgi:hypothetical protein
MSAHAFDLNIEKVLEHWPIAFALREFIANALDEQILSATSDPVIEVDPAGGWHIQDFGRGLSYEHLTQKENPEKRSHPTVIGQFGIGLKDALAVCDRHGVGVLIRSRYGDITTESRPKAGFPDIVTLHGIVAQSSDPNMIGTDIILSGVTEGDIETAKSYFLRYSGDRLLEETRSGAVLAKATQSDAGRIYVKGLLVADEPNFLFSYNVTQLNAPLRRALNRERSNVGRTAYSDRIKDILKESRTRAVVTELAKDLGRVMAGGAHDEIGWKDVAIHACRVLQSQDKVVFITAWQTGLASVNYAKDDGYRPVVVPDDIVRALEHQTDLDGNPMVDLGRYRHEWDTSFSFKFVTVPDLTESERSIYELTDDLVRMAKVDRGHHGIDQILISETMRLNTEGSAEVLGVWESANRRIVIRRDQLARADTYCGTLLHELTHGVTGYEDDTLEFEQALTTTMGTAVAAALAPRP